MSKPFESPRFLVQQTKENLLEFKELCAVLFNGEGHSHVVDVDPTTGDKTYKVKFNKPIPGKARYIAGAALNDLKHALDQAMCDVIKVTTDLRDVKDIYFPFGTHPNDLAARVARFQDLPQEIVSLLNGFESYPTGKGYSGGDNLLADFSKVVGTNKHQVTCNIRCSIPEFRADSIIGYGLIRELRMPPRWDMANNELIVGIAGPSAHLKYDFEMAVEVVFTNAGVLTGTPVEPVIGALIDRVDKIVSDLESTSKSLVC